MKVILKDYVRKLGDVGDVVNVKEGFARNFLLPNQLAVIASDENLKRIESIKRLHQEKHKHLIAGFQEMADRLKNKSVTITSKVNEAGRLYGSIGEREIAEALAQAFSTTVDPKSIELGSHIKEPGTFPVHIRFTVGLSADVQVVVVAEGPPEQPPAAAEQPEKARKTKTQTADVQRTAPTQQEMDRKTEKPTKPQKASRPPDAAKASEAAKKDKPGAAAASGNVGQAAKPAPENK